ncbi:MAG: SPOR domain-containing protein [Bradyrhizobiaceae bacterium]|nr:SPOR domain-containing protein [Bradyrhizobiaceae bacterium]
MATQPQPQPDPVVQRQQVTPPQPAPEPTAEQAPKYERLPDQRYDGYTAPVSPSQDRGQARVGHPQDMAPLDLSDPYSTDTGWRGLRLKGRTPRPDRAGGPAAIAGETKSDADQVQALAPTPPSVADGTQPPAPVTAEHPQSEPVAEQAYDSGKGAPAVAPVASTQPDLSDEAGGYDYREIEPQPRGRKLWVAVAVLGLAVIGTAGAYTYRSMVGTQEQKSPPPVIRADTSPKKLASPTQQSSNEKQIQERVGGVGATSERLVSREEQPMAVKDPIARALVPEPPPALSAPVTTEPTNARPFPAQAAAAGEPKKIRTVTIRPDGEPNAPAAAAPTASAPARAARPAAPAASPSEPQSAAPPAAAPARTAVATPPPRPAPSGYMVQISAQKSESDAQASFRAMQSKFPSVLGGRQAVITRKESSKGVYYGTQVGPFSGRDDANQLCEALKASGGNCFVVKN